MRTAFQRGSARAVVITLVATFLFFATAHSASAETILGPDLGTFAILGGAGVTFGGGEPPSEITGSIGACCNATAITGAIPTDYKYSGGTLYNAGDTVPIEAHTQLVIAMAVLEGMSAVHSVALSSLDNNSTSTTGLGPGVYVVSASVTDFNTTLFLDGGGNTDALWVFLLPSSLTTASNSNVILENTGAGAGVYWVMGASATLGANSTFVGNILADQAISLGTNVTDSCGSLLTNAASVTLAGHDTVSIGCSDAPDAPEPSAFFYLAPCLAVLVIERRRWRSKPSTSRA
jgi:Ice-binding-like